MSVVQLEDEEHRFIVVPASGEYLPVTQPDQIAAALKYLDQLIEEVRYVKRVVVDRAIDVSMQEGTRTIHLDNGGTLTLTAAEATVYDADEIRAALLDAGMPDSRVDEIVVPTVTYKVNANKAKSARGANPRYRAAIDAHTRVEPRTVYASVKEPPTVT